ncbi:hypothetical protein FACS1894201_10380 [Bacteroidia bacterium]|nr:hypothetical protein FACS1894201_10380 [Bacteroidia bacterium]
MIALLATAYFPPIDYLTIVVQNPIVLLDEYEYYVKQTYRNRCCILTSMGVQTLSVPILRHANHTPVRDIRIDYTESWATRHFRALRTAYNKAPFFLYYQDDLQLLITKQPQFLLDLNLAILQWILKLLDCSTRVQHTTMYEKQGLFNDYRTAIHPKRPSVSSEHVDYVQTFNYARFTPNLSILDMLFNCGKESVSLLMKTRINPIKTTVDR